MLVGWVLKMFKSVFFPLNPLGGRGLSYIFIKLNASAVQESLQTEFNSHQSEQLQKVQFALGDLAL